MHVELVERPAVNTGLITAPRWQNGAVDQDGDLQSVIKHGAELKRAMVIILKIIINMGKRMAKKVKEAVIAANKIISLLVDLYKQQQQQQTPDDDSTTPITLD